MARGWDTVGMPPLHRTLAAAATVVALSTIAAPASAADSDSCGSIAWAEAIVGQVAVPLPDGWRVALECDGDALTLGRARDGVVTIYVDQFATAEALQWTFLHELGHAYDLAYLSNADRRQWVELRGLPTAADWRLGDLSSADRAWSDIPAEDYAEAFAWRHSGMVWPDRTGAEPAGDAVALISTG